MTGDASMPENPLPFRSEARLLDSIGEAVIATDLEGKVIYWNKFAERLYGYASDEAIGRSIYELTVPAVSESLGREIVNVLKSGENWRGEFEVRRKDGSTFVAEVTDVPVKGEDSELEAIIGLSRDITERREIEREREHLLAEMEQANQAKDEFLALVSHELRTPVTTILGFAEILTRHYRTLDTDTIEGSLLDIRDASHRMHRLVDDLLTLSRSERQAQVELEPVALERLVQTVMEEHRRLYPARSVKLDVRGPLPPVLGHALYLEHVLANLLSNAEKYSPPDHPIEITCWQDGESIMISVQDRGVGVLQEESERIFESFYRSSRTRHMPGAGLGLSVCKRLVEAQAGRIWVEPRSGDGSTFCVSLRAAG